MLSSYTAARAAVAAVWKQQQRRRSFSSYPNYPLITFLSPSPAVSRRAAQHLIQWTSITHNNDNNNDTVKSSPLSNPTTTPLLRVIEETPSENGTDDHHWYGGLLWDSVVLQCQGTGTMLQWISPRDSDETSTTSTDRSIRQHTLLALQTVRSNNSSDRSQSITNNGSSATTTTTVAKDELSLARTRMFDAFDDTSYLIRPIMLRILSSWLNRPIPAKYLLGNHMLPILEFPPILENEDGSGSHPNKPPMTTGGIKEITIPFDHDAGYPRNVDGDGEGTMTLFSKLSHSTLPRPVTGLFHYGGGICIRPLPIAQEDRFISPPTLVFHYPGQSGCMEDKMTSLLSNISTSNSPKDEDDSNSSSSTSTLVSKIGYTGHRARNGQIMIRDTSDLIGLDIRLCNNPKWSSMFAEGSESLLASSLDELQSQHVLHQNDVNGKKQQDGEGNKVIVEQSKNAGGGATTTTKQQQQQKDGDCWVEFRANVKSPSGFFKKSRPASSRRARAPDLPYQ